MQDETEMMRLEMRIGYSKILMMRTCKKHLLPHYDCVETASAGGKSQTKKYSVSASYVDFPIGT